MWLFLRTAVSRVSTSITVHFLVTPSRGIQYTWVTNFFPFQLFPLHMWFKWYTETFHGPVPHAVYFNPYCHLTNCHVLGFMQICGRSELVTQNPFFFFFGPSFQSESTPLQTYTENYWFEDAHLPQMSPVWKGLWGAPPEGGVLWILGLHTLFNQGSSSLNYFIYWKI